MHEMQGFFQESENNLSFQRSPLKRAKRGFCGFFLNTLLKQGAKLIKNKIR